jgi:trehalose 6-phosphate synthase/phosphatase
MGKDSRKLRLLVVTHQLPIVCTAKNFKSKSLHSAYSSLPRCIAKKLNLKPATSPLTAVQDEEMNKALPCWEMSPRRGHSALFSGIRSLTHISEVLHIGWTGAFLDDDGASFDPSLLTPDLETKLKQNLLEKYACIPVLCPDKLANAHYEGFCKTTLWPIFHYQLWDYVTNGKQESSSWEAYVSVNQLFAEKIAQVYQPGDTSKF